MTSKLVLEFIVKNWKGILILLLSLGIIGKMRYDYKQLENAYEVTQNSLKAQIAGLKDIHERELAAKEETLRIYQETIEQIHREYEETQAALEEEIAKRRADYSKQFSDDPARLAEEIISQYGFEYVH